MSQNNILIILLLIANLIATVWFGLDKNNNKNSDYVADAQENRHQLPDSLSKDLRDQILIDFTRAFNSEDYESLYNMFGPGAKAQLSKEEVEKQFKKLREIFSSVQDGAFTHSEFTGEQGSLKVYNLNYAVKLPESQFTGNGTLKITVAVQGADHEIYAIRLNDG